MSNTKSKFTIIMVVIATVVLAGVALFTAVKLYNSQKQSVSPASPESEPSADSGPVAVFICNKNSNEQFKISINPGDVTSCPFLNYNSCVAGNSNKNSVSTYETNFVLTITEDARPNAKRTIVLNKNSNFCAADSCGQPRDPSFNGITCWDSGQSSDETITLSYGQSKTIKISRASDTGIACGSYQLDLQVNKGGDCDSVSWNTGAASVCQTGISCATPTNTPTGTLTPTSTNTPTNTPTETGTPTPTLPPNLLSCSELVFNIAGPTGTPTETPTGTLTISPTNSPTGTATVTVTQTATVTNTLTATSTPLASCNLSCNATSDCASGLICSENMCRNTNCTGETDCVCNTVTNTPTPTIAGSALPLAGVSTVTYLFGFLSIATIAAALLLAL
ncbi:MAG: Alpha-1,6-glucosidase, pullulanase-type [Candidatus Woesebacteria bacterium GW2011_GWA1_37_8]|uniref:Alpha-1,6-glucosidase, pullulanase-type n=1 Tax=Candidatus Woesebacteria bacterium GW2011_GWA1_37_8 TaxID=1618546 RepID=A0A0G0I220_9BACT|nr:MAG: Alpha-1,6-glucosidase, pullulanase-type [Candidatus Woesebacteria bacterium GW2011_GWA1_37_8]